MLLPKEEWPAAQHDNNEASGGSGLTDKGPVQQHPSEANRAGPVIVSRLRQESRSPDKSTVMRHVRGQARKSAQGSGSESRSTGSKSIAARQPCYEASMTTSA